MSLQFINLIMRVNSHLKAQTEYIFQEAGNHQSNSQNEFKPNTQTIKEEDSGIELTIKQKIVKQQKEITKRKNLFDQLQKMEQSELHQQQQEVQFSHRSLAKPALMKPFVEKSGERMEVPEEYDDHPLQDAAIAIHSIRGDQKQVVLNKQKLLHSVPLIQMPQQISNDSSFEIIKHEEKKIAVKPTQRPNKFAPAEANLNQTQSKPLQKTNPFFANKQQKAKFELDKDLQNILSQVTQEFELYLVNVNLEALPKPLIQKSSPYFQNLLLVDLQNNDLVEIEANFCQNLPNLLELDLRNNKISNVSEHIKALMNLKVLRLDNNQLKVLVPEVGQLRMLEELSISGNKLVEIPSSIGINLTFLQALNVSDNQIKALPETLGLNSKLKSLIIHSNDFMAFPCTFLHLTELEEFSLEWFLYAKPPKPKLAYKKSIEGEMIFESLYQLCNLLVKYQMQECALVPFLENYSDAIYDVNHIDNRQRTPLHNAAVKGDNGVLRGLLIAKANPNILDKDSCTPLCLAIREENFEAAQILIEQENVDVNLGGGVFGSPLHLAIVKLEIWLIQALIKKGADVNKTDYDGKTVLHFVMNLFSKNPQKCLYIAETLVMNGARPNLKDQDNWTPLHTAVRKGQEKGVKAISKLNKLLYENYMEQFDLNAIGGFNQWTALHLAAHGSHLEIVRELLLAGADVFQRNPHNQLPKHCAKGNYILTKFIKMAEQSQTLKTQQSYCVDNQFQLIRGLQMRNKSAVKKDNPTNGFTELVQGYNNFVSSLKIIKKHRPFASVDNLPKICQPEDHQDLNSPRSSSSLESDASINSDDLERKKKDNWEWAKKNKRIGPNFRLQSLNQMQAIEESNNDSIKVKVLDEKQFNVFNLKDILLNSAAPFAERLEALSKIKRQATFPAFKLAMETILKQFSSIKDLAIQVELISTVGKSQQCELVKPLQLFLKTEQNSLHPDVVDEINEAIAELRAFSRIINTINKKSKNQKEKTQLKKTVQTSGQKQDICQVRLKMGPNFAQTLKHNGDGAKIEAKLLYEPHSAQPFMAQSPLDVKKFRGMVNGGLSIQQLPPVKDFDRQKLAHPGANRAKLIESPEQELFQSADIAKQKTKKLSQFAEENVDHSDLNQLKCDQTKVQNMFAVAAQDVKFDDIIRLQNSRAALSLKVEQIQQRTNASKTSLVARMENINQVRQIDININHKQSSKGIQLNQRMPSAQMQQPLEPQLKTNKSKQPWEVFTETIESNQSARSIVKLKDNSNPTQSKTKIQDSGYPFPKKNLQNSSNSESEILSQHEPKNQLIKKNPQNAAAIAKQVANQILQQKQLRIQPKRKD